MGIVIYSASPARAFAGVGLTVIGLLGLGLVSVLAAVFQRRQSHGARLLIAAAGLVLILAGSAAAVFTLSSASSPSQSVALNLNSKRVVEENCGDNGQTCTRYVLEATTSTTAYDFEVPQAAYNAAQEGTCYQFTYYARRGLFADSSAAYQRINNVTRIETADPSTCE